MSFINREFMLTNKTAEHLYYDYALDMPIVDYHCHLDAKMIAEDHKFKNVTELMLGGDHYKWRLLRNSGVDEKYVMGDADDYEKWVMWAKTLPLAIGNPLFHWTQLELKRYFNIDDILCEDNAKEIWDKCNDLLTKDEYSVRGLISRSNVEVLCTTDDPADDLEYHKKIAESDFKTKVYPAMRPDMIFKIRQNTFLPYIKKTGVKTYDELKAWLKERIKHFNDSGCVLSDHDIEYVPYKLGDAKGVFDKAIRGEQITPDEEEIYKTDILTFLASEYKKYNWTMQFHIGAVRNNNKTMYNKYGPDLGFDSIGDLSIAHKLSSLLNLLDENNILPKTILYNLNPKDNYVIGTMLANFPAGRIQFGSGWWFNDQKDGMREQMKALATLGTFGKFIGMLTDSRSFISYTRHEYFRRVLCSLIGEWIENNEYPNNEELLKKIIQGICYYNAKEYLRL